MTDERLAARRCVAVIDYHTGLGPHGYGEPICGHEPGTSNLEVARRWYGDALTVPSLGTSSSVVTNGGQICNVLSWMVRMSTPASVHASATLSPTTPSPRRTPARKPAPAPAGEGAGV